MKTTQQLIDKFFKSGEKGIALFNRFYRNKKKNFANASFGNANFENANFENASFENASFRNASFRNASFENASFRNASFRNASFENADFSRANFRNASFFNASFINANFRNANFRNAIFENANLKYIIDEGTSFLELSCPQEGSFIAYKKASGKIVKIKVLEDALRSSATSHKCRCSKALVLEIEGGLTEIESSYDINFIYKVGEIVEVKDFDTNRWNECSPGIHFFLSRRMAECY